MSRYQPTLREAIDQANMVETMAARAVRVLPIFSEEVTYHAEPKTITADGFLIQFRRGRSMLPVYWPMSRVERRCDDCGTYLRASRDCGGHGFYYDARWLTGNPAERDPRTQDDEGKSVCMACFNRVRHRLRKAEEINQARLMIGRIKREARHAAAA
jgi:hypothetical protein